MMCPWSLTVMVSVLSIPGGLCGYYSCRWVMESPHSSSEPEVASREHLSLACVGGHIRYVHGRLYPLYSPGDRGCCPEVDV
jgi:hypothetical protein